ncbi:MAG: hypothetical protein RLO08_09645 [Parvibaculaceae bacterium]
MPSQSTLLGAAGEHFVMCELLRRNYIASLASDGVPNTDILVTDVAGQRMCSIQVKSRRAIGRDGGWHMKAKHENLISDRLYYCFVDFGKSPEEQPKAYILPSAIVAKVLAETYSAWLRTPGHNDRKRKETAMRRFVPDYDYAYRPNPNPYPQGWLEQYHEAWHLLPLEG